jgi:metal-dependent hydrolase (beta-lactamase superfamily II)
VDATRAEALILSHGHADHYGGCPTLAALKGGPGPLTLYAGGEDTRQRVASHA